MPTNPTQKKMNSLAHLFLSSLFFSLLIFSCNANQANHLHDHLKSRRSKRHSDSNQRSRSRPEAEHSAVFLGPQDGFMQADKITKLPGQPHRVEFDQYSGYVNIDPTAGKALFYYFVESRRNSSTNPLVLWLNGGPGCSSFGFGAMEELGPFRVNSDGKTLFRNKYAWNNVANVIFLESPAGVGFSYSNTTVYNNTGDTSTANDAYTFLVNWLERFPKYKNRELYIAGESYAGHYAPQLAHTILLNNDHANRTVINLKGIAIGNALIDDESIGPGSYDYLWTHALNSDETRREVFEHCRSGSESTTDQCEAAEEKSRNEMGNINIDNIYAPICLDHVLKNGSSGSVDLFDPCSDVYVEHYLNTPEVQSALHVKPTSWRACSRFFWTDWQTSVLPTIKNLMDNGLRVWLYSGDKDANVPVTSTRYAINSLKLPVETSWRPWYFEKEVGGYVVGYKGLTFVTVRGAGHLVPSYQPQRALAMVTSFLEGVLPPSS